MNKKIWSVFALVFCIAAPATWAQQNFSTLTDAIGKFADNAAPVLPAAASIGTDWSDAWIGDLLAVPPHFGVGVTAGAVGIPAAGLQPLFDSVGASLPSIVNQFGAPLPIYNINGRIGGFILPFDVGLKVGVLPPVTMPADMTADYLLIGADVRYALIKDGVLPGISVGAGFNYLKANIGYTFSSIPSVSYSTVAGTLAIPSPKATLFMESTVYELRAQISKSLLIITPYAGAVMSLSNSTDGATFTSNITVGGSPISQSQIDQLNSNTGSNFSTTGFQTKVNKSGIFGFRVYGGMSLNLFILKLDLQALYNLPSGNLGASIGARIQL